MLCFFFDDGICDVATRAILELGIKVPEELAIVTHANVGRQFSFPVEFTSIGWDAGEVVNAAWQMLEKLISGRSVWEPVTKVAPHLRMGQSIYKRHQKIC